MHGTFLEEKILANFDTMTDVHCTRGRVLEAKSILESMIRTLDLLSDVSVDLDGIETQPPHHKTSLCGPNPTWIANTRETHASIKRYADAISERCTSTIELLAKRLEFADKDEVQKQTRYLLQLSRSTVDDSVAVREITFITLIYLSCSVVGVSISTF